MDKKKYDAILFDLDGTLIDLDLDRFISAYVKALAEQLRDHIDPLVFADHLFGSTKVMVENRDRDRVNHEVFYDDFCRRINCIYEEIKPLIDEFYENIFPRLKCWGNKKIQAAIVVEAVHEKNLPLVLATNPIFPTAAINHRVEWAGLTVEQFDLITTMDNMHFCKPNPDYYFEIAKKIDCNPRRCLMAGNDTLEDLAAAKTGMDTFLVEDHLLHRQGASHKCNYRGSLEDLIQFVKYEI